MIYQLKNVRIGRLEEMDQHPGIRVLQILFLLIFSWGIILRKSFCPPIDDVEEPKARLRTADCTETEDMLKNTWRELEYSLPILRTPKREHIKIYWGKWS